MGSIRKKEKVQGQKIEKKISAWFGQSLYGKTYCLLTIWFLMAFLATLISSHGVSIGNFLFNDSLDTGMDFFNSVENTKGRHPYTQFQTLYPPLANLLFWLIQECVPRDVVDKWPDSLSGSVAMRGTSGDLRVYQVTAFAFLLFVSVAVCMVIFIHSFLFESARKGMIFGIAVLFSYGSMFALERGNIILYAYLFLMIFIIFYQSEKKLLREAAYISLSVSAGLKLYPALFGIMVLYEKRWKDTFRLVLYGCAAVFLPFILFDGYKGMEICFGNVLNFTDTGVSKAAYAVNGYSVENIVRGICFQISGIFHMDYAAMADRTANSAGTIKWMCIAVLAAASLFFKDKWKKLLAVGCIVLFIHQSEGYALLFLLPALASLCREARVNKCSTAYFILLCCIELPLPILIRLGEYEVYLVRIVQGNALLAVVLLLAAELIMQIRRKRIAWAQNNRTGRRK